MTETMTPGLERRLHGERLRVTIGKFEHTLKTIDADQLIQYPAERYAQQPDAYADCINDLYLLSRSQQPPNSVELQDVKQFFADHQLYPGVRHCANVLVDFIAGGKYIQASENKLKREGNNE